MSGPVASIDLGAAGALALLSNEGDLCEVVDMPVLRDGPKSRPTVNAALLAETVNRWKPRHAFIEFVSARPGEGAVGAFSFGRTLRWFRLCRPRIRFVGNPLHLL